MYHESVGTWGFQMTALLQFVDALLLLLLAVWNFAGHLFPWRVISFAVNRETGQLHRVLAYVYGTFSILAAGGCWALARDLTGVAVEPWDAIAFQALAAVAAGIGTVAPRIVRWVAEAQAREGDVSDYEQAIRS